MDRMQAMGTFVKVVETGSFSAAARQLRVGQPAVSKAIAQLEERLGLKLLIRSTRKLSATEAGQSFYEHAKVSIAEADEAELAARGAGAGLSGRLRISGPITFTRIKLVPHLAAFLAEHPKLEVELVLHDHFVDLIGEGIDVAIRLGSLPSSNLTARKVGSMRRAVLAAPSYLARVGTPATPEDLPRHESILYYVFGASGGSWLFRRGGTEISVTLSGRVSTTAAEAQREALIAGIGLVIAGEEIFANEIRAGTVVEILKEWQLAPIDVWTVFPSGRRPSAKARAFASFVEKTVM